MLFSFFLVIASSKKELLPSMRWMEGWKGMSESHEKCKNVFLLIFYTKKNLYCNNKKNSE